VQNIDHEQWLFNVEMFILQIRSKNTTLWYRPARQIYVYFCNNLFAINKFFCGAVNNVIAVEYNNVFPVMLYKFCFFINVLVTVHENNYC